MGLFRENRRISELEDGLRSVERKLQALELEWAEVYDKLRKAMGRIVKTRALLEARENGEDKEESITPSDTPGTVTGYLTPRQKAIQQQILRRRAGLGG